MTNSISLTIEKLVYGGDSLARVPENDIYPEQKGAVVFIPGGIPGEAVLSTLDTQKKPFKGNITGINVPSQNRTSPKCSVFDTCGGCDWQHMDYQTQIDWKQRIVLETLERMGKFKGVQVEPVMSANQWEYRNKAQWRVFENGDLAYLAEESHDPIAFNECHIIAPALKNMVTILRQPVIADFLVRHHVSKITARCNQENECLLVFHTGQNKILFEDVQELNEYFSQQDIGLIKLFNEHENHYDCLLGIPTFSEKLSNHTFEVSAQSFFQVNTPAAELMLETAKQWLNQLEIKTTLLDLYGGVGTFAVGLSEPFSEITLVESAPSAITDAEHNAKPILQDKVFEIIDGQVEQVLDKLSTTAYDVTLLDPPRKGCNPYVLEYVAKHTKQAILYISCDPTTLARDLKQVCSQGWKIERVQPIDMFPQTYHIETMVMLVPDATSSQP